MPDSTLATAAALTSERIALVQQSWPLVLPIRQPAAALFYGRLFELDPSLRVLFRGDLEQQGAKLMAALDAVVRSLARPEALLPMAQQLARRHVGYGVQPAHYALVGEALLWTLRQGLGAAATDEVLEAWSTAYQTLADAMKEAAWPRSAHGAEWQAQAA